MADKFPDSTASIHKAQSHNLGGTEQDSSESWFVDGSSKVKLRLRSALMCEKVKINTEQRIVIEVCMI